MKYLKIQNDGELDIRLIALMGGTTKANDSHKIGQFGTGLKYAISWLVRNENKFKLFIGKDEILFENRSETIGDNTFQEIYCNNKSMSITTRYGYQWKAWEAVRELWCNAKDEGGEIREVIETDFEPIENTTVFLIEVTEEIQILIDTWDSYFLADEPLFENDKFGIYKNPGEYLKVYKNRVLIHVDTYYKSKYIYDFKEANLNELRQFMGYSKSDIATALLQSNEIVIEDILTDFKNRTFNNRIEFDLDFSYTKYDVDLVKSLFGGHLYLHPESDRRSGSKSIQVNKSLFNLLQGIGLPTEVIYSQRGRSYSDSGYGIDEDEEIIYSEIRDNDLQKRIESVVGKYGVELEFDIVTPKDSDFEILIDESGNVMFSYDLKNQSDADLEAIVLIAILQQSKGGNIFKALKRLIKFASSNKAFKKIFFGE